MAAAENTIIINKAPRIVFDWLADGLNNTKWRQGVLEIALKSGQVGTLGAEYRQVLKGPGGRKIDGDYKLTEVVPDSKLAFVVTAGPARPEGQYLLKPVGEGTEVTFKLSLTAKGLMKLVEPMIAKTMQAEVANLDELKKVLEQSL